MANGLGGYFGVEAMEGEKGLDIRNLFEGLKKKKEAFQKGQAKRGKWRGISDLFETAVGFIPGIGDFAKPILDVLSEQIIQKNISVEGGPDLSKLETMWTGGEGKATQEEFEKMYEASDETFEEGLLRGATSFLGSKAGGALLGKGQDWLKLKMLPDAPFDPAIQKELPLDFISTKSVEPRLPSVDFNLKYGGQVPKYENGGITRKTESGYYEDAHPLYIASGLGKGTITEKERNLAGILPFLQRLLPGGKSGKDTRPSYSADENGIDYAFSEDLIALLEKTGGKLVSKDDPDFDPESESTQSLQELAEFLKVQVKSKTTSEFAEQTKGDKSEIIKNLLTKSLQTQSPYSDLGFFIESSDDMNKFQQAFGQLLEGSPLQEAIKVSPKMAGGGMVQGNTPSIVDYFSKQGKTLGGSDTESLAEKLGGI